MRAPVLVRGNGGVSPGCAPPCPHPWHSCQTQEWRPALGRKSARPLLWIWEEKRSSRRCP